MMGKRATNGRPYSDIFARNFGAMQLDSRPALVILFGMSNVDLSDPCTHVSHAPIRTVKRPALGCEDCMRIGGRWLHLRECLTCGHVGCCDSSPNKHATAHFHVTKHPIVSSAEPGESWCWCYVDERVLGAE